MHCRTASTIIPLLAKATFTTIHPALPIYKRVKLLFNKIATLGKFTNDMKVEEFPSSWNVNISNNYLSYLQTDGTERRKVNVLEMKGLRISVGVSRMDRVRNEEVCRRAGIERELVSRADQRVLKWFGHVEIMDEYRMTRRVLMAKVIGGWV